jgi:hypothetical protein
MHDCDLAMTGPPGQVALAFREALGRGPTCRDSTRSQGEERTVTLEQDREQYGRIVEVQMEILSEQMEYIAPPVARAEQDPQLPLGSPVPQTKISLLRRFESRTQKLIGRQPYSQLSAKLVMEGILLSDYLARLEELYGALHKKRKEIVAACLGDVT